MTPEQRTLAAAFLAECWPVCRELPRDMTLSSSCKARFAAGITDAISDTAGHIPSRSEQSFGTSLSRLVNVRENGCGRGCGTPAAAPLNPLARSGTS